MAKSNGGDANADSWPGFLSELTKSFLILRDIFGYAIPGAVYFAIGLLSGNFALSDLQAHLQPYQNQIPWWLALIAGIGACYVMGHLMSQIAYLPLNTWGLPWGSKTYTARGLMAWLLKSGWALLRGHKPAALTQSQKPPDDAPDLFNLREDHPVLLTEYDRQGVMTQLRGATGAAMLVGSAVFFGLPKYLPKAYSVWVLATVGGAFLLVVFLFSALPHMDELADQTKDAGKTAIAADQKQQADGSAQLKQIIETSLATAQDALKKL